MSPYEIDILLWYYARCEDHPDISRNPPIWRPTRDAFLRDKLLQESDKSGIRKDMIYELAERGIEYVDAIQSVPLPRSAWVMDWPKDSH